MPRGLGFDREWVVTLTVLGPGFFVVLVGRHLTFAIWLSPPFRGSGPSCQGIPKTEDEKRRRSPNRAYITAQWSRGVGQLLAFVPAREGLGFLPKRDWLR